MTAITASLGTLISITSGEQRELARQLAAEIDSYSGSFRKFVSAYREKGHRDWGVEGAWRKVIHQMEQRLPDMNDIALQVDLLQLRRNEKDYLLRGDNKYVDAVNADLKKLRVKLDLSPNVMVAKRIQEDLNSYEQSFRDYLSLIDRIGASEDAGLQGAITRAAAKIDVLLAAISRQAALSSEWARQKLTVAGAAVLITGIALATIFFYYFARAVAEPMRRLSEAAAPVGEGDLRTRMSFESENEVGVLARAFNQMLGSLSTLIGQVQKAGIQIGSAVRDVAATSKQQQATANEIAATTTQIGATAKQISATSRELAKTMGEVSTVAEQTASLASSGQAGLTRMEKIMPQVMEAASSISAKLSVLNEKAGNINQVVTTITKVADQTNLLSLNASIEAERAGEHGRGFAVVASEIRRLADQTAMATDDIEQIVKEIQSAMSAGVMGMEKFSEEVRHGIQDVQQVGGQLSQIIEQVQALVPRVEGVNEGMQAQATGAEQISEALLQLTETAQQTAESLRQSTLAIDELNQVSGNLRTSVSRFKLSA